MTCLHRTLIEAAQALGLERVSIVHGRHPMVRGWFGGRRVTYSYPHRPCPYRGLRNAIMGLRRAVNSAKEEALLRR
jgi:hypothetical protein